MVELLENSQQCQMFDQHPFKKEKCKVCGLMWNEHKGVIDETLLKGFLAARQKVIDDKARLEAEAAAKAKAAKQPKKRSMAVEDAWLFDEAKRQSMNGRDSDSEGEVGFKMFTQDDIDTTSLRTLAAVSNSQKLKVTNLIDFGECDLPEEFESPPSQVISKSSTPKQRTPRVEVLEEFSPDQLISEITHLRQMLHDANEEKNIQVAIIQDEMAEKQQTLDNLVQQCAQKDANLETARQEIVELRAQLSGLPSFPPRAAGLVIELRELSERTRRALSVGEAVPQHTDDVQDIEALLHSIRDSSVANLVAVERTVAERNPQSAQFGQLPDNFASSESPRAQERTAAPQDVGRQAAQALREAVRDMHEVRLNAEQQFAWISKVVRTAELRRGERRETA